MNAQTLRLTHPGPVGPQELAIDRPPGSAEGLAVIAHPHPLFGGTLDNKVVQTLVRAFLSRGLACVRPNFRGVGASSGVHDEGRGEQDDLWAAWQWAETHLGPEVGPKRWAAGFSFGAVMTSHIMANWESTAAEHGIRGAAPSRAVLVGLATQRFTPSAIDQRSRLIHGEQDEVVPLAGLLDFARDMHQPVLILPGAGHFFHGQLTELKDAILREVADD